MNQSYFLLTIAILTTVLSQLCFKQGVLTLGEMNFTISNLFNLIINLFKNPYIFIGLIFYGISFLLWIFVVSKISLSIAYPITSLNFVLVIVLSYFIFHERLTLMQYCSITVIILGVVLLTFSK